MKFRSYFLLFSLLMCPVFAYATQSPQQIDEEIKRLKLQKYKVVSQEQLLVLYWNIYNDSKAIQYDQATLKILKSILALKLNNNDLKDYYPLLSEALIISKKLNDYNSTALLLNYKSWYLINLGYYKIAKDNLLEAENLSSKITNTDEKYYRLSQIYLAYSMISEQSDKDTVAINRYIKQAYEYAKRITNSFDKKNQNLANTAIVMAGSYAGLTPEESEGYLQEAELTLQNEDDKSMYLQIYKIYGQLEFKRKNYRKSINYYQKALEKSRFYGNSYEEKMISKQLVEPYKAINQLDSVALYQDKYIKISDSLRNSELKLNESQRSLLEPKNVPDNLFYKFVWIFISFLTLLIVLIFRKTLFTKRQDKKIENIGTLYNNEFVSNKISREVEAKESATIKQKIDSAVDLQELLKLARENEEVFYIKFHDFFPDFLSKINQNNMLTKGDIEICKYIKLNFDTKEIAMYTNSSIKSVESRKYRLRKKFNLDRDTDLYQYLNKIL